MHLIAEDLFGVEERLIDEFARIVPGQRVAQHEALDQVDLQQERGEACRIELARHGPQYSVAAVSRTLHIQPLTAEAFAPFGDVIEGPGGLGRADDLANVQVGTDGRPQLSVLKAQSANALPLSVKRVERHPLGTQAFIPMGGGTFFVVVAPPGEFDPAKLMAFRTNGSQGINYKPGTWHHGFLAAREGDAFLIVERFGPGENCDFAHLAAPVIVTA